MKSLKNIIRNLNNNWQCILPMLIAGVAFNIAFAQTVLPRMPSGPRPIAPISAAPIANAPTIGELAIAISLYQAKDYEGALSRAVILANRGDANAAALAGYIHEMGFVKTANIETATQYYRNAAQMNNTDAMIGLGRLYNQNKGSVGAIEARTALDKAYSLGRKDAGISLANILFFDETNPDRARAFSIYKAEADNKNIEAAYLCGLYLLELDAPTDADMNAAGKYLEIAANGNIPQAQALFGVYNYLGSGGERNLKLAAEWFEKSAKNKDPDGMFYWALINAKGEGIVRNLQTAHEFAARAKDIEGENQASATRLWQQIEEIRARQSATNVQNSSAAAPKASPPTNAKAAKRQKRR